MNTNKKTAIARAEVLRGLLSELTAVDPIHELKHEQLVRFTALASIDWQPHPSVSAENIDAINAAIRVCREAWQKATDNYRLLNSGADCAEVAALMNSLREVSAGKAKTGKLAEVCGELLQRMKRELPLEGFEVRQTASGSFRVAPEVLK